MMVALVILCTVLMNLLANRELVTLPYFCQDCGSLISWIPFAFALDVICKRFGGKASATISVIAIIINLATCGLMKLLMLTPGHWGEFYARGAAADLALNTTFGGAWYVVIMSGVAAFVGAVVNAILNQTLGRKFDKGNFKGFMIRSYISTFISIVVNVFVFAACVSHVLFGWTWSMVFVCAITGSLFQLLFEVVFSPLGYKMVKGWERDNVGQKYLELIANK